MKGLLIFLGIITLIGILPVGASVLYDEAGLAVKLLLGPLKILLLPRPKKEKKEKKQKDPKPKTQKVPQPRSDTPSPAAEPIPDGPPEGAPAKKLEKPKKGGSLTDFLPLADVALDMLASLIGRLRVNFLRLHLILGSGDPADLAINYGRAQAAGATLLAKLNRFLVIKKQDVQIQCDFTSENTTVLARVDLTITVGRALGWAVGYGLKALITYLKIKKQREKQDNQV